MFAEVQTLTPMVPTRELCFARYCKKLAPEKWAIVDASFGKAGGGADASSQVIRCWKNASGCIIEEQTNGHSRVTWVEHAKHREPAAVPSAFRAATASGLAFGARRWLAMLRLQCERMVFSVATNVPTRDSNGNQPIVRRRRTLHGCCWVILI
jgi:homeobox-leucine zipper protein